jgi:U3 small nucleolar RNA-associated protein 21
MWNMQSGAHRKSFNIGPCPEGVHTKYRRPPGKQRSGERTVTGLATDSLNRVAIASTLDGTVNVRAHAMVVKGPNLEICSQKFFDFHTSKLEHTLVLSAAIDSMTLQRDSGLLAIICDDLVVRLLDIETHRIVREFGGFGGRVLDLVGLPILGLLCWSHPHSAHRPSLLTRGGL